MPSNPAPAPTAAEMEIDEIKARLDALAPGDWTVDGTSVDGEIAIRAFPDGEDEDAEPALVAIVFADDDLAIDGEAAAEFIAHARHDVSALLAEIDGLRAALASAAPERGATYREPEREEWHADWMALHDLVEAQCTGHPDCPAPHAALGNLLTALKSRDIKLAAIREAQAAIERETAALTERLAREKAELKDARWKAYRAVYLDAVTGYDRDAEQPLEVSRAEAEAAANRYVDGIRATAAGGQE